MLQQSSSCLSLFSAGPSWQHVGWGAGACPQSLGVGFWGCTSMEGGTPMKPRVHCWVG